MRLREREIGRLLAIILVLSPLNLSAISSGITGDNTVVFFCSKLQDLVPQEEMDLLAKQEIWNPITEPGRTSQVK